MVGIMVPHPLVIAVHDEGDPVGGKLVEPPGKLIVDDILPEFTRLGVRGTEAGVDSVLLVAGGILDAGGVPREVDHDPVLAPHAGGEPLCEGFPDVLLRGLAIDEGADVLRGDPPRASLEHAPHLLGVGSPPLEHRKVFVVRDPYHYGPALTLPFSGRGGSRLAPVPTSRHQRESEEGCREDRRPEEGRDRSPSHVGLPEGWFAEAAIPESGRAQVRRKESRAAKLRERGPGGHTGLVPPTRCRLPNRRAGAVR